MLCTVEGFDDPNAVGQLGPSNLGQSCFTLSKPYRLTKMWFLA